MSEPRLRKVIYHLMIHSAAVIVLPFISNDCFGYSIRFDIRTLPMNTLGYSFLSLS